MSRPSLQTQQKLRHLQRVMFATSERKFDIRTIGDVKDGVKETQKARISTPECVSACCMLGYAGFDPWMRSKGLESIVAFDDKGRGLWLDVKYNGAVDVGAANAFFSDLGKPVIAELFGFEAHWETFVKPTKRDAILNIERVIRGMFPCSYTEAGMAGLRKWGKGVDLDKIKTKVSRLSVPA